MNNLLLTLSLLYSSVSWTQTDTKVAHNDILRVDIYQTGNGDKLLLRTVGDKTSGIYLGTVIRPERVLDTLVNQTIYYLADFGPLLLSSGCYISFSLTNYKVSARPFKIDRYGIVEMLGTRKDTTLFPAGLYNYHLFGQIENDKVRLQRTGNLYDDGTDQFVFTKVSAQ